MLLPHSCSGPVLIFPFSGFEPAVLKAPVAACPPGASQKTLDGNHTPVVSHRHTLTLPYPRTVCVTTVPSTEMHTHTFWTRRTENAGLLDDTQSLKTMMDDLNYL